jgi:Domain of unknown function (DUF1996)
MRCIRHLLVLCLLALGMFAWIGPAAAINNGKVPEFIVDCPFSHRLPDDPIMDPDQPGKSHSHDFFGNTTTDAFSTLDTLLAGSTTCAELGDTAAYWAPTVYQNGEALQALKATVYYRNVGADVRALQVFPAGFRMIGGNTATSNPLPGKMTGWACRKPNGLKGTWTQDVPKCMPGQNLVFRVQFPECWNGQLDSADHRSHVARIRRAGLCPADHSILIPRVSMTVAYRSLGGSGVTLSSGSPIQGAHMDFLNAWDQPTLIRLVHDCLLQTATKCRFVVAPGDNAGSGLTAPS